MIAAQDRLDYLATLSPGWMGAEIGSPIHQVSLQNARQFFTTLGNRLSHRAAPGIFPCEDGSVLVEWFIDNGLWSIEFDEDATYAAIYDFTQDEDTDIIKEQSVFDAQDLVHFFLEYDTAISS